MSLKPKVVDFDETWGALREGVLNIIALRNTHTVVSLDLHNHVYRLCTALPTPFGPRLYTALRTTLEEHAVTVYQTIAAAQGDFVAVYVREWDVYSLGSAVITHTFKYLNDNWIRRRIEEGGSSSSRGRGGSTLGARGSAASLARGGPGGGRGRGSSSSGSGSADSGVGDKEVVHEIHILCLAIWRDTILLPIMERLRFCLLDMTLRHSMGENVNAAHFATCTASMVKLGLSPTKRLEVYREHFETYYLEERAVFYAREVAGFLANNTVTDFIKKAEERIADEVARSKLFLDPSSHSKVLALVEEALITKNLDVLQGECSVMVKQDRSEDLGRMFGLLARVPNGVNPLIAVMSAHIIETGLAKIKEVAAETLKKPGLYMEAVISHFEKYLKLVRGAFRGDSRFLSALELCFHNIINDTTIFKTCKSPEILARYCDSLLRKGKNNLDDSALETRLDQVIDVFRFMDDKDIVQRFYIKFLSKRLIAQVSVSDDAEMAMITRLKNTCGYEYVNKIQRMFNDTRLSDELNASFATFRTNGNIEVAYSFSVQVLTAGAWPLTSQSLALSVPAEMERPLSLFETFYYKSHVGRKLSWLHHLSTGEVKTRHLSANKLLQVSGHQMIVLLAYNRESTYSVNDLVGLTGLKPEAALRVVQALVAAELLTCSDKVDAITSSSRAYVNSAYKNKRVKVLVGEYATAAEVKEESASTSESVNEDRKLCLQAAIVRVMKNRKTLNHQLLISEVVDLTKALFKPSIPIIKRAIEQLIDKGYLERDKEQAGTYIYVA